VVEYKAMNIALAILGYLLFVGLILIHEWGHYIAAKRSGVKVEEFGLGFPPRAYGKKRKDGMILSINWLPLGGFVKLKGEHDMDKGKGSYGSASLKNKTKIMLAGITMNFLVAILMFTILAWIGMPKVIDNQFTVKSDKKVINQQMAVGYIDPDSPAAKAGIQSRDIITSIRPSSCAAGNQSCVYAIKDGTDLRSATKGLAGQSVNINVQRSGENLALSTTLRAEDEVEASKNTSQPKGYIGLVPVELEQYRSTWSAPVVAVGFTAQLTKLTLKGIATAFAGLGKAIAGLVTVNKEARVKGQTQATEQTGGIVAIVRIIWDSGSLGFAFMLMIIAILSLSLAIINLLPIPALDGGRLAVTYIFKFLKRPLTPALEERIHGTGMAVLLTLFVLITIVDVKRFY
jgi:regulator of sigma E protease